MTATELQIVKALRDAGFDQGKAEAITQAIFDAIRDNVATKSDVELVRSDLKLEIQALKIWIGGAAIAAGGILFAALHMWPPHIQ